MIPLAYLRLLPIISILVDDSLATPHAISRNSRRTHPQHLTHRSLTDFASAELENLGSSILTPLTSTSVQKETQTFGTPTHPPSSSTTGSKNSYVQPKYVPDTSQPGLIRGINASISVGATLSGTGYSPSTYQLKSESSGKNFFDNWDFFSDGA